VGWEKGVMGVVGLRWNEKDLGELLRRDQKHGKERKINGEFEHQKPTGTARPKTKSKIRKRNMNHNNSSKYNIE